MLQSINPFTNEIIKEFEEYSDEKVEALLNQSHSEFETWKRTSSGHRRTLIDGVSRMLRSNINKYSTTITTEMGKPVRESIAEVEKCAWVCDYYSKDTEEAIGLANQTKYGLGVSLFTNDLKRAGKLVHEFQDGAVFINSLVKSDPRLPFGGTGHSGFGRELAIQGIREFVNVKTVCFKKL